MSRDWTLENKAVEEFENSDDAHWSRADYEDYYEGYNPLENAKKKAKKHSKGMSRFSPPGIKKEGNITVKQDAGNVEKGIEFFNNAMGSGESSGESVGESLSMSATEALDLLKNITDES